MNKKISISEILFYIPYSLWLICSILEQTYYREKINIAILVEVVRILLYFVLFLKILYENKFSYKSLIAFFIMIFLGIITINSYGSILIDTFLIIYSSRNLDCRKIISVTFKIEIFMLIFIVISSLIGLIKNDIWYRNNSMLRYGLGYVYSTFIANYYFHIVLIYLYLKKNKKFKIMESIVILLINYLIYLLTDTRAAYYLIILVVITSFGLNFIKKDLRKLRTFSFLTKYCFPISASLSIITIINYNPYNRIYFFINEALTGRLRLGYSAYNEYGIKLLGQKIAWVVGRAGIDRPSDSVYNFVDCSYLNIALVYGIIILILLCIGFIFIGKRAIEENDKYLCLVLVFLAIHSITDPQLIELRYNPFLIMFGLFFYNKRGLLKKG